MWVCLKFSPKSWNQMAVPMTAKWETVRKKGRAIDLAVWLTSCQGRKYFIAIAKGQQNGHFEINFSRCRNQSMPSSSCSVHVIGSKCGLHKHVWKRSPAKWMNIWPLTYCFFSAMSLKYKQTTHRIISGYIV